MKILVKLYLKDLLRNKMLGLMVLLVPIIFYPLIYWGVTQFLMIKAGFSDSREITLRYTIGTNDYMPLEDSLRTVKNLILEKSENGKIGKKRMYLKVSSLKGLPSYTVFMDSSNSTHKEFYPRIENKLISFYEIQKQELILKEGFEPEYFDAFNIEAKNTEGGHEVIRKMLSLLIPLMSVISIISSAAAASVEMTSGHMEDRTAETSLTTPVKRESVIISKLITVNIYALLAGTVNFVFLVAFIVAIFKSLLSGVSEDMIGFSWNEVFSLKIIMIILISLVLTSFFVSIIFVTASGFASKRKEGSVMISPFTALLTYLPLVMVIPAIDPNIFIAATPVLNISFSLKLLIENNTDWLFLTETALFSVFWLFVVYKFFFPFLIEEEVLLGYSGSSLTKKIKIKWSRWKKL